MPSKAQIARDSIRRNQVVREFGILTEPFKPRDLEEERRLAELAKKFSVTRLPYLGPK